ncbi:MAG: tryptophan synthase subunit alpha [Bdellovibrionota bacterium]|nr:MAG: tryptophan synthase subunit alpha [Pseudomonadota bacterium]
MSRLTATIEKRLKAKQKCFVAYLTAGDPDLEKTVNYVEALAKGGADIIELGIPFSDPLADGPVNQRAAERALLQGVSLSKILGIIPAIRKKAPEVPLVIFSYMNPIFAMGFENFAQQAEKSGADAVLVVDLPPEESLEYRKVLQKHNLDTIFLASPTSNDERLKIVDQSSSGFVYYVSRTGVTGAQTSLSTTLHEELKQLRKLSKLPIMVGFGISNAQQAKEAAIDADGVIVGSAIVKLIEEGKEVEKRLEAFAKGIRESLDH